MSRDKDYNEYFADRSPSKFAEKYLYFWHKRMYDIASKTIPDLNTKSLLEVGVGFGYFARACRFYLLTDYSGIDMNKKMIEELSNQGYNVFCSTIPPFPDEGLKVDVIWLSQVLEHAKDYMHARDMLQSAYSKLNNGGFIVVIVPDYISWGRYFFDIDWSHGFPLTRRRLHQILSDVGFDVVLSQYHVATVTNGALSLFLYLIFRLIPVRLFDWISEKIFGKTYCSSWMSLFGWRQIISIAKKQSEPGQ